MIQGWHNNEYLVLFGEQHEAAAITERYGFTSFLPGYTIVGLEGWDDFILKDEKNQFFTVPTVPVDSQYLQPISFVFDQLKLQPDGEVANKIKWYLQPLVFGGDPKSETNMAWITLDQHIEAVKWWNQKYREIKQSQKCP